jgi:hypothetical protein
MNSAKISNLIGEALNQKKTILSQLEADLEKEK